MPYEVIDLGMAAEYVAIKIKLKEKILLIINIYLPAAANVSADDYNLLPLSRDTLLLGDSNAFHPMWGSLRSDKRGCELAAALDDADAVILNDTQRTHVPPSGKPSLIDLSISSTNIARLLEVEVQPELAGSDHLPILIKIANHHCPFVRRPPPQVQLQAC